ncbi:Uncharacterised protein [Campylobacter hyointestinalis]|uniref:hypothetical protein n=1 Tax=Campylobacter hyointestinalis TaxID=198 RepID=UPI000726BCB6|nr:hypothetical protein [Campylobacter hyointestinalis]PPB56268.1 hypothetical protein CDQ67_03290 [Campylobacter hyointestinalis subsp. hyointestinalis]CUU84334.1 Uncharacterised protein [Campylobacter hyointestinalis]
MKKIFIFMICVLFGIELYGGVWCNNDEGKSSVEQIGGSIKINSFETAAEDIIVLNNVGAYKFKLVGDNINTQHGIDHWDQLSLRIKTGFASKISVKITKAYQYKYRISNTIKGEVSVRNIWFKFIKSNVTNYDKKERGGWCFNRMLNNVEAGGYAKFENGIAYLPKDDTANIIFEASNPQSDTYEKFKFEAEITVEPDDRKSSLGENGFLIVNDQFNKDGDSENLYTQIVKRPFNVKLITNFNRDLIERDIASISITLHSKTSGDALNDAIEKIDLSKDDINNLNNKKDDSLKIINLDNKFSVDNSKKKLIDYSNLYFMVRIDSENPFKSDTFAARPAKFNKRASFNKKDSLIGGKKYYPQTGDKNDFVLVEALDDKGNVINDYNVILENQRLEFDRSANRTKNEDEFCTYYYDENGIKTLQKIEPKSLENVWIKFSEGIGTIYTKCEDDLGNEKEFSQDNINNKSCYFVYPDIGHTKISITDNKTTIIDEEQDDCISGSSSSNTINGKIGCNVQLEEVGFHTFIPSSINFVSRDILNYYDNYDDENHIGLTYLSTNSESYALSKTDYEISMAATLNLSIEARLADGTLPKLYSKNCYAKSIKFSLKDKKLGSRDIKFYGLNPENRDENASIAIKFPTDKTPEDNDKVFWIDENTFLEGKSLTQVKMSIDKKDEVVDKEGRNPIIVKTSDIDIKDANEFSGDISKVKNLEDIKNLIRNDQTAINVADIKNYNDKTGNFFYGLLIIPDVSTDEIYPKNVFRQKEELRTYGNKAIATAYYSVFCDDECINGVVASEEDKEIYKNIIIKTIGEMDDRSNVPGNQGFYISKFVDDNIIKTKYKPKDNNVDVVISKIDDKETKDGWGQVELTYNPTAIVRKKIKFIPYLVKDGKETDTIATWLYPIEDTSTKDTFDVEFAPNAVWFGTGSAGQVMGIGKDYNGNSTNDEQKGKRQQRIDW